MFSIITACSSIEPHGIGRNGKLPWNMPDDLRFFRNITTHTKNPEKRNVVIMGRKTFESIGSKPLPYRINICITSRGGNGEPKENTPIFIHSFSAALTYIQQNLEHQYEKIFVIGGEQLYIEAIQHPSCDEIIMNEILIEKEDAKYDTFFPEIDPKIFYLEKSFMLVPDKIRTNYYLRKREIPRLFTHTSEIS